LTFTQRSRWRGNAGLDDLIPLGLNERSGNPIKFAAATRLIFVFDFQRQHKVLL
jgi:hypothetical protein